ncbi:DarT ssDNA thymidine ADP-ribosyltransferase family protein [Marinagarivorans algicola]|uniref:DarT ssDNA thymidine ADP-ribosyltransferase family protein n=1 Tax=Marinagarivorans algicola TaxID=1513270 RepID=UPI0006B8F4BD|nr:DarT ssDNA thymidine ADP-ribosyltransferase family protein [Marinagarivorans algicola]
MTKERDGKLLYHLTSIDNLESIFQKGLQSRSALSDGVFSDVADGEIIASRKQHGLEDFVPFHFFAKSPFDYGVQRSRPEQQFVLLTVRRSTAKANNWKVVPRHPLAQAGYEILDYIPGFEAIDWALIAQRDYDNRECKVACMAECLSPNTVLADKFCRIFVKNHADHKTVSELAKQHAVSCHINLGPNMFAGDADV